MMQLPRWRAPLWGVVSNQIWLKHLISIWTVRNEEWNGTPELHVKNNEGY